VHPVRVTSIAVSKATAALMGNPASWRVLETLAVAHLRLQVMAAWDMAMAAVGIEWYK